MKFLYFVSLHVLCTFPTITLAQEGVFSWRQQGIRSQQQISLQNAESRRSAELNRQLMVIASEWTVNGITDEVIAEAVEDL